MSAASIRFPLEPTNDASTHAAAHRHVGPDFLVAPAHANHFVQFYEEESALFEMVGEFLAAGLRARDRLLVIATPEHRDGFLCELDADGAEALADGRLVCLDARQTLARFLVGGYPDPARFRALIAEVMGEAKERADGGCVRAYGEMVDLLWRDGNADAALRLEELWNEAGTSYHFSLFCAYTIGHFYNEGDGRRFYEVCRQHTHIIPTEAVARQKSLEKEIAHRQELEDALRTALRNRTRAEEELRAALEREENARKQAEGAVQFREFFLGMVGHDLRNPLNTIMNTARVMAMRGDVAAEDGRRRIERILASGERMERMVEQLLDVTRARLAQGIPIRRVWQDCEPVVMKMVTEARAANPGRDVRYQRHGECWARVDADRFEQVVSNLVGNAIAHGPALEPVTVELVSTEEALRLSVHNGGRPIDPAFMPALFDPFFRKEKAPGQSRGLGLGLYIVERIVQGHGGSVRATSSAEGGTVFEATLPKGERDRHGDA